MNYMRIYNQMIEKRLKESPVDQYTERHHIVPKCLGGVDDSSNIVELTTREHFIAHWLLYKHYRTPKLAHAWYNMLRCGKGQQRNFTSRQRQMALDAHRSALSESMRGANNHFYGKTHTAATKNKISEIQRNRVKSPEEIDNWVKKVASKSKSAEHRRKIGRKGLIVLEHVDTHERIRVKSTDPRASMLEWVNPRKLHPEAKVKCDYCGVVSNRANIKRWHNENCKHNPTNSLAK